MEVETISSIPISIIFVFCFGSTHVFFTMPLTKGLARRIEVNDDEPSLFLALNGLLLHIMCGTKRLNPFFRLHEAS